MTGDDEVGAELFRRHRARMTAWFAQRLPSGADPQDLVSDVFLRAYQAASRTDRPEVESVDR